MTTKQLSALIHATACGADSKNWQVRIVNPVTRKYEDVQCLIADEDGKKLEVICADAPEHAHYKAFIKDGTTAGGGLGVKFWPTPGAPAPYDADALAKVYDSAPECPQPPAKVRYVVEVDSANDGTWNFRGQTVYLDPQTAAKIGAMIVSSPESILMGGGDPLKFRVVELTISERVI